MRFSTAILVGGLFVAFSVSARNALGQSTLWQRSQFLEKSEAGSPPPEDHLLGPGLHGVNGIRWEYVYTGEVFTNMRGGISTHRATRYKGNLDLFLTAHLDEMDLAPGGMVFIYASEGHGQGITEQFVGDYQEVSNIDFLDIMQVSEYWWERSLFDDFMRVRIGKQDANAEFAVVDMADVFINGAFGQQTNIPIPSWPYTAMGISTFFTLTEQLEFRMGIWDGLPDVGTWGFSDSGTAVSMYELKGRYDLADAYHGEFHAGVWYHNGDFGDLAGNPVHSGCFGVHLGIEQVLYRERPWDEEDEQGFGAFAQYGWSPEDQNPVPHYFGAGLVYQGPLPERDDDIVGAGVAYSEFSDLLDGLQPETTVELFYLAQLTPWMMVQPDLQYICHPSGEYRDAFVFGLRFELDL